MSSNIENLLPSSGSGHFNVQTSSLNQGHKYLDWTKRPPELVQQISKAFDWLSQLSRGLWSCNGSSTYHKCGINEQLLLKKIIQKAPESQKDFYVLDIGAGDFQWGHALADFINNQKDLPKDIAVHIINVRAEKNEGEKLVNNGICRLYDLGGFKAEELATKLPEALGFSLEKKVDLEMTSMCFFHLVDPVGTFVQAYDLLRPEKGYFVGDGFWFFHENETMNNTHKGDLSGRSHMIQLLTSTHAPFLTTVRSGWHLLDFVVKRPDDQCCQLPMSYINTIPVGPCVGGGHATQFKCEPDAATKIDLTKEEVFYGDQGLYQWALKENLILDSSLKFNWEPIQ